MFECDWLQHRHAQRGAGHTGASDASASRALAGSKDGSGAKIAFDEAAPTNRLPGERFSRSAGRSVWSVRHSPRDLHSLRSLTFIARSMLGPECRA